MNHAVWLQVKLCSSTKNYSKLNISSETSCCAEESREFYCGWCGWSGFLNIPPSTSQQWHVLCSETQHSFQTNCVYSSTVLQRWVCLCGLLHSSLLPSLYFFLHSLCSSSLVMTAECIYREEEQRCYHGSCSNFQCFYTLAVLSLNMLYTTGGFRLLWSS